MSDTNTLIDNIKDPAVKAAISDPIVRAADELLEQAFADLSAGKLTRAEFDEIALDILDFQKVANLTSDVERRATIYSTYQTIAGVLKLVLPLV